MIFRPSDEQVRVRSAARRLYDSGCRLIGEMAKRIPELTMQKWRVWEGQAGFLDWWSDLFPEHSALTACDLRALEYSASQALLAALAKGEISAVGMVIKLKQLAQAKEATSDTDAEEWYSSSTEENWLPQIEA